jgi:hypothetical protein
VVFGPAYGEKPEKEFLHIVDVKTNRVSKLPGSERMRSVRWSPMGDFIAGESVPEARLMLYDLRAQKRTELFGGGIVSANWSKDGEFVYFFHDPGWWRARIRDRKVELVHSVKGISPADWGWFTVAPNDSLVFARSTGTGEIYALDLELP